MKNSWNCLFRVVRLLPALLLFLLTVDAGAAILPPGFAEIQLAGGLNPTAMALAPDGRLFLAQKDGRVLIVHADGTLHDEPFLKLPVDDFNERGLGGIALHPDFEQQPWVYLYYTVPGAGHNRVSRILANGDFAVPGSEQVLLDLDPLGGAIHNGGGMTFGPDDNLYIGVGDGANPASAQNLNALLGKILRLNANGAIPADNPFYNQASGNNRAIFALGARNPFSMSCDRASGRIFFCDVGNGAWEEVNEVLPGRNYGWSLIEGPAAGQTLPANYREPLFAYPHTDGCAAVGAAFGFAAHPSIPAGFQGKFFFADYCKGWIKMLDPVTGVPGGTFATGIDRPVSLVTTPGGELYYFARAGLGGGSPGDNTASNEGTLWKVFWIGEGAPRVTGHPQDLLAPAGESAHFSARAFGSQPIQYQWLKNGIALPGSNTSDLTLSNVSLADSGAMFACVATNSFGADTSTAAILHVTANQRPEPEILLPSANARYRCGDTLQFSGQATDAEEGILSAHRLSWRIDFHHAGHTHPALSPVQGISEGLFYIPTVGETATDVFFRVYLSAIDTAGLVKTVWRDIQPEFTSFQVNGPAGIPVNIDGQIRAFPASVPSVIDIQRTIQATEYQKIGDTLYYFRHWSNGQSSPVLSFFAPEVPATWEAIYDRYTLGTGNGLRAEYFFDPNATLEGSPVLVRVDTVVNFDWGDASPDANLVPADFFSVRWTGQVEPVFDEPYTFSVLSDDGCRLWVGDSLLIDKWQPQAATEHSGTVLLEGGRQYPIRLEYYEIGGGASAQLFWKSARQPKEIIPKRQLYQPDTLHTASVRGTIGIDENANGQWEAGETTLPGVLVTLIAAQNDSVIGVQKTLANGAFVFPNLGPGDYYLHLQPASTSATLIPSENVDINGESPVFALTVGQARTLNAAWIVGQSALYGTAWLDENRNAQRDNNEAGLENIAVLLYRANAVFSDATATNDMGGYVFPLVEPGDYFLLFSDQLISVPLAPGHGLNTQGRTPVFPMNPAQGREVLVAFEPVMSGTTDAGKPGGQLAVYPNPARERLWASLYLGEAQEVSMEIIDHTGRLVQWHSANATAGNNVWPLAVEGLETGVYVLVCRGVQGVWARRWVKG